MGAVVLAWLQPTIILAALLTIPLTFAELSGQQGRSFLIADWAIWSIFAGEYLLGLALTENRRRYFQSAWLSLLIVIVSFPLLPMVFAAARLTRLARLLRMARLIAFGVRAVPALKSSLGRQAFLYLLALYLLMIVVAGALMSVAEPQTIHGNFWDGIWWAVVTATTVGYGDISPATPLGRIVAVALMLFGIGLTATLAASVAAYFVKTDAGSDLTDVTARLERVEQLLKELHAGQVGTAAKDLDGLDAVAAPNGQSRGVQ